MWREKKLTAYILLLPISEWKSHSAIFLIIHNEKLNTICYLFYLKKLLPGKRGFGGVLEDCEAFLW